MELSNTESIAGKEVVETLGLVRGNTVRARNVGRDITQGLRNLAGGELKGYTELMTDARDQAQDRMIEEAEALGADGVINVRFTTSSIADSGAEISRTGPRCGCGRPAASPPRLVLPVLLAEHVRDLLTVPYDFTASMMWGITFSDPRGLAQRREGVVDRVAVAVGFHRFEALALILLLFGVDLFEVHLRLLVHFEFVDADDDAFAVLDLTLALEGDILDLPLDPLALDGLQHATAAIDLLQYLEGVLLDPVGEVLDVVRASERVDRVGGARLVGEDLLGAERGADRLLGRERERLVFPVGVEALGPAEYRRECLIRHPDDVVLDLLGSERRAAGLGVELELFRFRVLRVEPLLHDCGPHPAGGAELRGLLEDVVVGVKEEGELRGELVDVEPGVDRGGLHVLDPVAEGERDLLGRRRPASRMWYPEMEMVLKLGISPAQNSKMSVMSRIEGSGG